MESVYSSTGLRGNHNEDGVSKSLLSTKVPVPRIQPPKEDSDSSSESESDGVPEMDHMQWFKDAVRKMAEDGVVECTDLRSLEIDIQIQTDEYWILREKGERLSMLPIAFFIR